MKAVVCSNAELKVVDRPKLVDRLDPPPLLA
jgi:hypothetical protein